MDRARAELEAGNVAPTHLALSEWYDLPGLAAEEHKQLNDLLDRLAGTVIYSNQFHYLDPYIVQQGDTLDRIAQQCQVSPRLLGKINGIESPSPLQPGETLKVIRGPFNAVVDTANLRMTLFLQGRYAGRFPIGLGADRAATPGEYQVTAVVENPQFQVDNRVIPGGDPSNPLGRYWIDLGNNLGLHGTNDPRVIGRADGRGCISLSPQDMDHLCDILAPGSKVQIRK
jgi:lipoprotein-anchoring transpeptidase ErfK/SrfK